MYPPIHISARVIAPSAWFARNTKITSRLQTNSIFSFPASWLIVVGLLLIFASLEVSANGINIELKGLTEEARKNVLLNLSIAQPIGEKELTEEYVRALHARSSEEIRQAIAPLGYYRSVIDLDIKQNTKGWSVTYRIKLGPRLNFTRIDLKVTGAGGEDSEFRNLIEHFPIKVGDPLHHDRYEEAKTALQGLASERGYLDAHFLEHTLKIDPESKTAEATLHFGTGPRYRFGPVYFKQTGGLELEFLERFVPFKPGDPFATSAMFKLRAALSDTDYFQQVEVNPIRGESGELDVPIEVTLSARKPNKYTFGLGFGTDTGARGKLGWERRIITERGHRFLTELNVSEIRTALSARYTIPVGDPRTDQIAYFSNWAHDHPETSDSRTISTGLSYSHARNRWRETWSTTYHREQFRIADESRTSSLLIPSVNWLYVRANDRIHTERGVRLAFEIRGAADTLASDVSFVQTRLSAKFIRTLGSGRLIVRGDGGNTSVSHFEDLPATLRFYAGGDQSVRGYDYNTLGPRDDQGRVIGGRYLLVGSLEYEYPIIDQWSAALFYDSGKAFNHASDPFSNGAGGGLRWRSPIGPIRIDVASAVSREGRPWRLHITIGPDL